MWFRTGMLLPCFLQAHQQEWLHGSWEALDGEVVEKDVATAHKVVYKAGRAFTNRGATQLAANCDAVRTNIEEFRAMVPLVQVGCMRAAAPTAAAAGTKRDQEPASHDHAACMLQHLIRMTWKHQC